MSSQTQLEIIARHLLISGRVQGVSYRYYMVQAARELSLVGWCRNLPDGRVEAFVQGPRLKVEELLDWAHKGSPEALVEDIQVQDQAVLDMLSESVEMFEVRK